MRLFTIVVRVASLALILAAPPLMLSAQSFASSDTTHGHASPDRNDRAVARHGKHDEKPITALVHDGIYSVDGLVARTHMNYTIDGADYLYLFVPGVGTAVVSLSPMEGATLVPDAYGHGELTLPLGEHTLNVTGVEKLAGSKSSDVYVMLDTTAWKIARTPMFGFGSTLEAPYAFPRSAPASASDTLASR